jgi:hypothetical protein
MLDLGTLQLGVKVDAGNAKSELSSLSGEVEKTGSKTEMLASKAKTMIKAFVAAYAVKEIAKLGKAALDAYAQYEQLEGGVNKIFGKKAAQTVMANANQAYKTAGMSANKYMETVTNFSASLIQSMGGNTEAAAKVADMAIQDMSDNANTFGTNMQSIQDAYQGFAKQNYTMLDNLKLGYGGTKTEMERLLKDAEKLTGKKYNLNNLNDVFEAIHAIQKEYNITGTTAKEAGNTIEGSINQLKASWENMLTAIGGGGNMNRAMSALIKSAAAVAKNVIPRLFTIVKNIVVGVIKMLPKLVTYLSKGISKLADMISSSSSGGGMKFLQAGFNLVKTLLIGMARAVPALAGSILSLVLSLAQYFLQNASSFIAAGKQMLTNLVTGFLKGHPKLQKAAKKLINIVFKPLEKTVKAVTKVIKTLHSWWKKLLGQKGSKKFTVSAPFTKAINAIKSVYEKWKNVLGQTAKKVYSAVRSGFTSAYNGMTELFDKWKDILKQKAKKTWTAVKSGFGTVLSGMKSLYNKWKDILAQKAKKTFTTEYKTTGKPSGSGGTHHRIGLREVPYDGYEAILHKGEAVMTAAEVNKLKKQGEVHREGDSISVNVYGSANMDVNELAAAVERRIINIQKRRTNAWA